MLRKFDEAIEGLVFAIQELFLQSDRFCHRGTRFILSFFLVSSVCLSSAVSANDGAESAYRDIKTKVTALRADNKARRFRHSYEKLIRQFEGFIKKHPKTERTDDALL